MLLADEERPEDLADEALLEADRLALDVIVELGMIVDDVSELLLEVLGARLELLVVVLLVLVGLVVSLLVLVVLVEVLLVLRVLVVVVLVVLVITALLDGRVVVVTALLAAKLLELLPTGKVVLRMAAVVLTIAVLDTLSDEMPKFNKPADDEAAEELVTVKSVEGMTEELVEADADVTELVGTSW